LTTRIFIADSLSIINSKIPFFYKRGGIKIEMP